MSIRSNQIKFEVERITGSIGAIVSGVDLSDELSDETMETIDRLLGEHSVLFFLDQTLNDSSHRRFGAWFGELDVHHSQHNLDGFPEIYVLENYKGEIEWHADITYLERPARASVLRSVVLPATGGDTIWSSTCAAYDALSPDIQRLVDGLHAVHDSSVLNSRDPELEILSAVHPVVIDHPMTGRRSIFVNPMFTKRIVELNKRESAHVLAILYEQVQSQSHQVRWRWRPNTVAMWDNLATQHCVAYDYSEPRSMRRVTIKGGRPKSAVADALASEK